MAMGRGDPPEKSGVEVDPVKHEALKEQVQIVEVEGDPVPHRTAAQVDVEVFKRWTAQRRGQQRGRRCLTNRSTRYSSFSSWVLGVNSTCLECPTSRDCMASCHHRESTDWHDPRAKKEKTKLHQKDLEKLSNYMIKIGGAKKEKIELHQKDLEQLGNYTIKGGGHGSKE
uniref:Uncharacterized protein n=1 Tax=Oryza meridionalis TaxID=40149 RepID=A0A0E0C0Y6_9ORYZ